MVVFGHLVGYGCLLLSGGGELVISNGKKGKKVKLRIRILFLPIFFSYLSLLSNFS